MTYPNPSDEDKEELLLSCRFDELDEIKQFIQNFGPEILNDIRDDNNNTIIHMVAANGHTGMLENVKAASPTS